MALTKISRSLLDTGISDSSDATAVTITSAEKVMIGSGTSNAIADSITGLQITGSSYSGMLSLSRHDNNQYGAALMLGKSRNTTVGSNTIIQDDDVIATISFHADDGTNLDSKVATIEAAVDGTPGANDTPGRLTFSTTADGAAAPSERMRIDSSGKVGIGRTTMNAPLHIGAATPVFRMTDSDTDRSAQIVAVDGNLRFDADNEDAQSSTNISFKIDNSERMRIDSSGNVYVGTTASTGALFDVKNTVNSARTVMTLDNAAATATNQYGLFIRLNGDPNNATNYFLSCTGSSATRARIDSDGGIQNYQSNDNNLCDEREKKNIEDLSSTLDAVKSWKIKKFHYQEDEDTSNKRIGVIAQDVETSHPELISDWIKEEANEEKGTEAVIRKGVKEQQMYWMAIKAIQEQQEQIEALQSEINTLKGE